MVASAISLNLIFSCALIYWHKQDFLGQSILSQSQTALEFLSHDIAEGNYRRAMEQLSSKNAPVELQTQSILFYDLATKRIVTSNNDAETLHCRDNLATAYFENFQNGYLVCIPIHSRLLVQIAFTANWAHFLQTPLFLVALLFNLIFAGLLILLVLLGMNLYLDRFILLLNKLLKEGTLDQTVPHEFSASFRSIKQLSSALENLKEKVSRNTRNAILSDLYEKVLHNIRSPLGIIRTTMPLIIKDDAGESKAIIEKAMQDIEASVAKALEDCEDGHSLVSCNLYEIVEKACHEAKIQCTDKQGIEILPVEACSFSRGYTKSVDPIDFKSAIVNILNNAIEAMPLAGSIQIEMSKEGEQVKICVTDEGSGIAEDILPRVGERGFSYGKKSGNGLGLYSLKQDIQSWGGFFKIGNRQGQRGAEAIIIL